MKIIIYKIQKEFEEKQRMSRNNNNTTTATTRGVRFRFPSQELGTFWKKHHFNKRINFWYLIFNFCSKKGAFFKKFPDPENWELLN